MPRILPSRGALLRRRTPVLPQISIATPVSPQPPGAPILVSGTYGGSPTAITLVWRQNGQDISAPVAATTLSAGQWSATLTTPAQEGDYVLRVAFDDIAPVADSEPIQIVAGAAQATQAAFVFEGTGTTTDTVALFGHAFERGMLAPADPVVLRRTDTQAPLRTQLNPLSTWTDGSVKTALLAAELPALADQATLTAELVRGAAHPDPGSTLAFTTALSGRSAVVTVYPASGSPWVFDVLGAIGADRWHQGPLALSTRVATAVPQSACGVTSVRLMVDVVVTKEGFLELDVCFSNDRVQHSGGGIATFGYTITIDGTTVYDQRPSSGAARQLLQYSQWIRRRGRAVGAAMPERPFVRPDLDLLVRAGVQLDYDRSQAIGTPHVTGSVDNVLAAGSAVPTDPYWHWGLARGAGDVGGRPEIGYRTFACAMWLRDGYRNAISLAHRQFEAASTRGMYFYDWDLGRWLNPVDWPRMAYTAHSASPAGTSRATATGLPSDQRPTHNTTDHITIDHAHHGSFNWTVALLSGRRLAYDGLAARSAWASMDQQIKANGALGANVPDWRSFTPDHTTGRAWAVRPWAPQTRSWAWDFRDIVDCATILPDGYEGAHRLFYDRNVEAWVNSVKDVLPLVRSMFTANVIGTPMLHADENHLAGFMYSFIFYGAGTAMKAGVGGANLAEVVEGWTTFRTGSVIDGGYPYRSALAGGNINVRGNPQPPFNAQTWAEAWAKSQAAGMPTVPEDWSAGQQEGDWQRNTLSGLALMLDLDLPVGLKARVADSLVLLRSERQNAQAHPHPRTQPNDFFSSFFMSNTVTSLGVTWQWDSAPVIVPGQSFQVAGDAAPGAIVGVVRFTGPIPRNSDSGLTPATKAWEITAQPAGDPFTISQGGAISLAGNPPAAGTSSVTVRARTYNQNSTTPILSAPVTVSITTTAVPAEILSVTPASPQEVLVGAPVGTTIYTVAVRGNAPITPSIASGNTTLFEFVPATGNSYVVRTRATLSLGTYPLTLRVENAHGQATIDVSVGVVENVTASVVTLGQTIELRETMTAGQQAESTIAYTGDPPGSAAIIAGNDAGLLASPLTIDGAQVRLFTAGPVRKRDVAQITPTIQMYNAANAANPSSAVVTVNVAQPWVHRAAAPSLTYIGVWSIARRLVETYTGPLIRIRRASDNAEADIGFVPSGGHHVLDEAAVTGFAGASNWFIRTIYDQSTEGAHLQQANASVQPLGGASGGFTRVGANNRAGALFGSNRRMDHTFTVLPAGDTLALYTAVQMHSSVAGFQRIAAVAELQLMTDSGPPYLLLGNGGVKHSQTTTAGQNVILYARHRNVISAADRNRVGFTARAVEVSTGGNNALTTSNAQVTLGTNNQGHNPWPGRCAELVLASALTVGTEEAGLYAAAGAFFGV
ncbi:arabinofuranosidase catalytic domain-containing protein [Elioraea sp.]|uniref:arabinofuranosidase catalytic domain-containing protein n=1 Tax=Elioraea sp. TaxID=2185103 RepID=UPI003F71600E